MAYITTFELAGIKKGIALSDVEPLYREAFFIKFPIKEEILNMIRLRHDVIHRNGYTKSGTPVAIARP